MSRYKIFFLNPAESIIRFFSHPRISIRYVLDLLTLSSMIHLYEKTSLVLSFNLLILFSMSNLLLNLSVNLNSSVAQSCLTHARPPCPSPTPGVYPYSCPLSWWCHPTISSSFAPFSSCLQSFPSLWVKHFPILSALPSLEPCLNPQLLSLHYPQALQNHSSPSDWLNLMLWPFLSCL